MIKPYAVLKNDAEAFVLQLNIRAYSATTIRNDYPNRVPRKNYQVAFNTNYYQDTTPIGLLWDGLCYIGSILLPADMIRPAMLIDQEHAHINDHTKLKPINTDQALCHAGPRLLRGGKVVDWHAERLKEKFQGDVYRRCPHLTAATNRAFKLILIYSYAWTPQEIADYCVSLKLQDAMKMDGGHSAYLRFQPDADDKKTPACNLGNQGRVPAGIMLFRRDL